jgi:hypothetical protein
VTVSLSQGDLEILVSRELRKAGLALSAMHVRRRTPLPEAEGRWTVLLEGRLRIGDGEASLLVECHDRVAPIDAERVRRFVEEARAAEAGRAMIVSTSGFVPTAVAAGGELGVALLAVADGVTAWRSSPWGSGRPPAWFPEYVALLVTSEAGLVRTEPLASDRPDAILSRLRPLPPIESPPPL